jgi:hypothetical protein
MNCFRNPEGVASGYDATLSFFIDGGSRSHGCDNPGLELANAFSVHAAAQTEGAERNTERGWEMGSRRPSPDPSPRGRVRLATAPLAQLR